MYCEEPNTGSIQLFKSGHFICVSNSLCAVSGACGGAGNDQKRDHRGVCVGLFDVWFTSLTRDEYYLERMRVTNLSGQQVVHKYDCTVYSKVAKLLGAVLSCDGQHDEDSSPSTLKSSEALGKTCTAATSIFVS